MASRPEPICRCGAHAGTQMQSDHALLDVPVAIACYYPDTVSPRIPSVGVAAGPHIFIYRNLRPHYKFTVPPVPVPQPELDVWEELRSEAQPNVENAVQTLTGMRDEGKTLTSRSLDLLGIGDPAVAYEFVEAEKHTPLTQQTVITCMEVLQKSDDGELGMSSLVIGTESKKVYIIKHTGYSIACECELPSVPVMMAITGSYGVGYRIVVACRDAKIYTIKGANAKCETNVGTSMVIELEAQPCGLVREGKSIFVGTMGNQFHSFHIKGKKNFTVYLPAHITQMELLDMKGARKVQACVLALANGEVRVYNDKALVSTFDIKDEVTGLRYGKFGREDNTLILALKSGALSVKMLPRNVDLEKSKMNAGPPPEQDIPLTVPKKTKLYIEQTQRERDQAVEMHRLFQRDLCKLRLATARAYVKVLTDGHGPLSYTAGSSLRLNPQVQGLGPIFRLKVLNATPHTPHTTLWRLLSYYFVYCLPN
jgi:Bardet-Biedl syndrome 1 protein